MPFLREKCPTVRGLFEDRSGFVREKPPFAEQTTSKPPAMSVQERVFVVSAAFQKSGGKTVTKKIGIKKTACSNRRFHFSRIFFKMATASYS